MATTLTRSLPRCCSIVARSSRVRLRPTTTCSLGGHYSAHSQTTTPSLPCCLRSFSSNDNGDDDTTTTLVSQDDLQLALDAASSDAPIPGAQTGGKKLAIVFTCTVCNTRSAKQFTEQAYQNGVVMVRCPKCENLHLIADRLGYFQNDDWDIEQFMQENGEKVTAVTNDNVLELTLKDVLGDKLEEAAAEVEGAEKDTK